MAKLNPFDSSQLEAVCKVLGNTESGLSGSEIGYLLRELDFKDVDPPATKWKRLFNAFAHYQNINNAGNCVVQYVNAAMRPARYLSKPEQFKWLQHHLNISLSFAGYKVSDEGKVVHTNPVRTLSEAQQRAGKLKATLEARGAHQEIYKYCKAELLADNYFHTVFEACKGLHERLRVISGLKSDGAELVNTAFSIKNPLIYINDFQTETEISEHKGIANLLIGLFGAVRNPIAHAPKIIWDLSEQDAVDILALVSFIHRKLDIRNPIP